LTVIRRPLKRSSSHPVPTRTTAYPSAAAPPRVSDSLRVQRWRSPTRAPESGRLVLEGQGLSFKSRSGTRRKRQAPVTFILFVVTPPVVVLCVLILRIKHAEHFAPQAYYRKKTGGAPVAFGYESLGPRPRKRPPPEDPDVSDRASRR